MLNHEKSILITNCLIIGGESPISNGWLRIEDGLIHSFGSGNQPSQILNDLQIIDAQGGTLLPGFIDLHTHGAVGADFVYGTHEDILRCSGFYAEHGVTGFLATTYAASPQEIHTALDQIQSAMGYEPGSRILGVHLEGPWLNPSKAGAQNRSAIRIADHNEVIPYLDSGLIRLIALAPEIKGNQWLITACKERDILVSAGHTEATYQQMIEAVAMGVTQVTHCFNAMNVLHHREPGVPGAALSMSEIRCELIADNIHVHPAMMKILLNAKSADRVILITDAIAAAGMPDGIYSLEGQKVICKDHTARLEDGTLAGSTLTMDQALRNFLLASDRPLSEVWQSSSLNAARALGIADHTARIAPGFDADLVLLDSNLHVQLTICQGTITFQKR